ncbi:hypothetical protein DB88DRAFT_509544 [Papiliotrema laurentii]|uniref:Uncharacterized protein n=1 Tax=Papiliotrema laurentii TaxID=5418 RepID=A0AAD9L734_PAPLA|nr:hypothetical protein DB88DRAFT_509544 [Papiliotrema laurentii]
MQIRSASDPRTESTRSWAFKTRVAWFALMSNGIFELWSTLLARTCSTLLYRPIVGGSQAVLICLACFRCPTKYRVFARIVWVANCLARSSALIVPANGLTPRHGVAEKQFLSDLHIVLGVVGVIASTVSVNLFNLHILPAF